MNIADPTEEFKSKLTAGDNDGKYQLTLPETGFEAETVTSEADSPLPETSNSLECESLGSAKRALVPTAAACVIVLTILAVAYSLYFSKAVTLPILGAFLLNFLLSPVVAKLKGVGIPNFLGSLGIMTALVGGLLLALFFAYDPATRWIENKDQNMQIIETKLFTLRKPFEAIFKMTEEFEHLGSGKSEPKKTQTADNAVPSANLPNNSIAERDRRRGEGKIASKQPNQSSTAGATTNDSSKQNSSDQSNSNTVVPVEVQLPSISNRIFSTSGDVLAGVGLMLVLLFYLLSAGDRGLEKLVELMPSFRQKKRTVELSRAIEKSVSSYMLTTFIINLVLGTVIGIGMWMIGMPNPILWGLIAMQLNFFPFLGAMVGAILVFFVAVISFDSVAYAFWAPGIYLTANLIEANLITPHVLGRSVSLHPVWLMIFFVIVAWIWGLGGAIIAVPTLAVIKISCDHIEALEPIGQFLGR